MLLDLHHSVHLLHLHHFVVHLLVNRPLLEHVAHIHLLRYELSILWIVDHHGLLLRVRHDELRHKLDSTESIVIDRELRVHHQLHVLSLLVLVNCHLDLFRRQNKALLSLHLTLKCSLIIEQVVVVLLASGLVND